MSGVSQRGHHRLVWRAGVARSGTDQPHLAGLANVVADEAIDEEQGAHLLLPGKWRVVEGAHAGFGQDNAFGPSGGRAMGIVASQGWLRNRVAKASAQIATDARHRCLP